MIDDEARQRAILEFLSTSKEDSVQLTSIQQAACPDAEIVEIEGQIKLAIDKGFLLVTPEGRTGKDILLLLNGMDGYLIRPIVTSAGLAFIQNRKSRELLENAPKFLALAKLGKIAISLVLVVVVFTILLFGP